MLYQSLLEYKIDVVLGNCEIFIPNRFRRIDGNLHNTIYSACLKVRQLGCTDVAFRSFRSWHLAVNRLVNVTCQECRNSFNVDPLINTAVIVGAGPSLDLNVTELRAFVDKILVIATDASVNTLLRNGIVPHAIVSMDDTSLTWRFIVNQRNKLTKIPLLVPYEANHVLVRHYPGSIVFISNSDTNNWFSPFNNGWRKISLGRCVGHLAFHIAESLKMKTIILVGCDLAFSSDGATHAKDMEVPFNNNVTSKNLIKVQSCNGNQLVTDLSMDFYKDYFEAAISHSAATVINATENGVLINGAQHVSLKVALRKFSAKERIETATTVTRCSAVDVTGQFRQLEIEISKVIDRLLDIKKKPLSYLSQDDLSSFSYLPSTKMATSLMMDCSNSYLLLRFQDQWSNTTINRARASCDIKKSFLELIEDHCESAKLIEIVLKLIGQNSYFKKSINKSRILVLDSSDLYQKHKVRIQRFLNGRDPIFIQNTSSLPRIWQSVWNDMVDIILTFNGSVFPDMWSVPGVSCLDIKTEFEPKDYERSLWIPGYTVAGLHDGVIEEWRNYLPKDINCIRLEDVNSDGKHK